MVNDSAAILVELGLTLLQIIDVVSETGFFCLFIDRAEIWVAGYVGYVMLVKLYVVQ